MSRTSQFFTEERTPSERKLPNFGHKVTEFRQEFGTKASKIRKFYLRSEGRSPG